MARKIQLASWHVIWSFSADPIATDLTIHDITASAWAQKVPNRGSVDRQGCGEDAFTKEGGKPCFVNVSLA